MMTLPLPVQPTQSFPRAQRIAKRREFLEVYEAGRKESGRHSMVFVHPNKLGHPRIGITVTRKAGKSHVRNRLRRWTREIFRTVRAAAGLDALGVDLVVNVKPSAASVPYAEFSADLTKVFGRCAASRR